MIQTLLKNIKSTLIIFLFSQILAIAAYSDSNECENFLGRHGLKGNYNYLCSDPETSHCLAKLQASKKSNDFRTFYDCSYRTHQAQSCKESLASMGLGAHASELCQRGGRKRKPNDPCQDRESIAIEVLVNSSEAKELYAKAQIQFKNAKSSFEEEAAKKTNKKAKDAQVKAEKLLKQFKNLKCKGPNIDSIYNSNAKVVTERALKEVEPDAKQSQGASSNKSKDAVNTK